MPPSTAAHRWGALCAVETSFRFRRSLDHRPHPPGARKYPCGDPSTLFRGGALKTHVFPFPEGNSPEGSTGVRLGTATGSCSGVVGTAWDDARPVVAYMTLVSPAKQRRRCMEHSDDLEPSPPVQAPRPRRPVPVAEEAPRCLVSVSQTPTMLSAIVSLGFDSATVVRGEGTPGVCEPQPR